MAKDQFRTRPQDDDGDDGDATNASDELVERRQRELQQREMIQEADEARRQSAQDIIRDRKDIEVEGP